MTPPAGNGTPPRPLHIVLVLDRSGSMAGERIAALNFAVRSALPALREAAADHPETPILLSALAVSDEAAWHGAGPLPPERFEWSDLAAGGETAMGAAMHRLAEAFGAEAWAPGDPPPVLVLVSDGHPTDDYESGLRRLLALPAGRQATRIAIAIGEDADLDGLARFMDRPGARPLVAHDAETLANRIRRAVGAPARPNAPPETQGVPAAGPDDPTGRRSDDDLIW